MKIETIDALQVILQPVLSVIDCSYRLQGGGFASACIFMGYSKRFRRVLTCLYLMYYCMCNTMYQPEKVPVQAHSFIKF